MEYFVTGFVIGGALGYITYPIIKIINKILKEAWKRTHGN